MKRLVVAAAVLLAGCATAPQYKWVNNNYQVASSAEATMLWDQDVKYCRAVARGAAPMPALAASVTTTHHTGTYDGKQFDATSRTSPGTGQMVENLYKSYQAGEDQRAIHLRCMNNLGWENTWERIK